jgi:hypothetical protein
MDSQSERIARRLEPWVIAATSLIVPVLILQGANVE